MKPKRIVDKELLKTYHNMKCLLCNHKATPSHIKTKGSGGPDLTFNLTPLCIAHHTEWGQIGWQLFCAKYPVYLRCIKAMGWEKNGVHLWNPKINHL